MNKHIYTAVLIDDEEHCIKTLKWNLTEFCPEIEIIGEANTARDGYSIID